MYLEKCWVLKVLCISTSACVYLNWQHPSPDSCTEPSDLAGWSALQHSREKQSGPGVCCSGAKLCERIPLAPHLPLAAHSFLYPPQSPITLFQAHQEMSWWPLRHLLQMPPLYMANNSFLIIRPEALKDSWKKGLREILLLCVYLSSPETPNRALTLASPCLSSVTDLQCAKGSTDRSHPGCPWLQCLHIRPKALENKPTRTSTKLTSLFGSSENKPVNKLL